MLLYIDPGAGSFITQFIIAAGLALMYFVNGIRSFIAKFFRTLFGKKNKA